MPNNKAHLLSVIGPKDGHGCQRNTIALEVIDSYSCHIETILMKYDFHIEVHEKWTFVNWLESSWIYLGVLKVGNLCPCLMQTAVQVSNLELILSQLSY